MLMNASISNAHSPASGGPRSVMRLMRLLDAVAAAREGRTLAHLSAQLASPKSSLLTLLRPLVAAGYLMHVDNRYRLGAGAYRLASAILATRDLSQLMTPYMEELVARTRESVFLAILDREARLVSYADRIDSPQAVRYSVPVGAVRPLYCSAAGLLLLAYQEEDWRERYLKTVSIKPLTPDTVTSRTAIRARLETIRAEGVSISIGEAVPEVAGIAAPIFDPDGSVSAALLIGAPADRFRKELPKLREIIVEVARSASGDRARHEGNPAGPLRD
jgi:DNA-binding IclR family transcriptional regulator